MRTNLPETDLLNILMTGMAFTGKSLLVIESKSGLIVANNAAAESIFGYEKGELLGKHVKSLDAESYIGIRKSMHDMHDIEKCWNGDIKNRKKDGTMILTATRSVGLGDYYLSFQEEITQQQYLDFFTGIYFKESNAGFIILDEELDLIKINKTALGLFPKETEHSIEGKNILEIDPTLKKHGRYRTYLKVLESGKPHKIDCVERNGQYFQISVFRINNIGLGIVSVDITEQFKALKKAEAAQKESEDLNRFKDTILRNVTHEFRTPLNGLNGFLDILAQTTDDEAKDLVDCMKSSADRLRDISNKFIDSQVIGNKKLMVSVEVLNVNDFMSDIFSLLGHIAVQKQIDFVLNVESETSCITTDKEYLSMIIMNLVSNAIKFSSQKGRIEVKVLKSAEMNEFQVIDNGIGIAPNDRERIFERFYQVGFSSCRRYEGIGLGLFNSLNYARLLKGDIEVESKLGQGAVFTLKIPDLPKTD